MKNLKILLIVIVAVLVIGIIYFVFQKNQKETTLSQIRVGWQTAWAPQAQLAQALKHTNILEKNGIQGEFKGFSYGGPLNEAALAGEVDVILTADFPAINLLSKSDKWVIISRLIDYRGGIIVPKDSSYKSVVDLKGKIISSPFGSAIHLYALNYLKESGLDKQDFKIQNLDFGEQASIIQRGSAKSWGEIDAFVSADPPIALGEETGKVRILQPLQPQSVLVMSTDFINNNPEVAKSFVKSFIEAYYFYAKNQNLVNEWFRQEAKKDFSDDLLNKTASLETNIQADKITDINITINDYVITQLEKIMDEAINNELLKQKFDIRQRIDHKILGEAKQDISKFNLNTVETK